MVKSKQGQEGEWRGLPVLSVCVFVVRHWLCVSLFVCLTVGYYVCMASHWLMWVAFVPFYRSVCRLQVSGRLG